MLRLGISPDLMTSVINLSSGRCFASENYNPVPGLNEDVPASRGYTKGLKCHHAAKVGAFCCWSANFF